MINRAIKIAALSAALIISSTAFAKLNERFSFGFNVNYTKPHQSKIRVLGNSKYKLECQLTAGKAVSVRISDSNGSDSSMYIIGNSAKALIYKTNVNPNGAEIAITIAADEPSIGYCEFKNI